MGNVDWFGEFFKRLEGFDTGTRLLVYAALVGRLRVFVSDEEWVKVVEESLRSLEENG